MTPGVRFVYLVNDMFSQQVYNHHGHEMRELGWCAAWLADDGRFVVDCGANIGWFSAFLSQRLPQITFLAVEGNQATAARAVAVLDHLGLRDRVDLLNVVLGDGGSAAYVVPDLSGREAWQQAQAVNGEQARVPNATLDQLTASYDPAPDLIKIDCEGFETRILRGATALLDRCSAAWMVECNQKALQSAGSSASELIGAFRQRGYVCRHLASFDREIALGIDVDASFPSESFNFVATPDHEVFEAKWQRILARFP